MDAQVLIDIQACQLYQSNDKTAKPHLAPLQSLTLLEGPWQKVSMDIIWPFKTAASDCRYAITVTDCCSKWPEVAFTRDHY